LIDDAFRGRPDPDFTTRLARTCETLPFRTPRAAAVAMEASTPRARWRRPRRRN